MNPTIAALEHEQREHTAREYERQGYHVIRTPAPGDLPPFLHGFTPDIIAYGPEGNVVVEVKTRTTIVREQRLPALTEVVNAQPGWRIDLVMTALKRQPIVALDARLLDEQGLRDRIAAARLQLGEEDTEAALLLGYAAIEVLLRRFGESQTIDTYFADAEELLRDAYSLGMVNLADYESLRTALSQRNALVHGYRTSGDLGSLAARVIDIAEALLTVDLAAIAS